MQRSCVCSSSKFRVLEYPIQDRVMLRHSKGFFQAQGKKMSLFYKKIADNYQHKQTINKNIGSRKKCLTNHRISRIRPSFSQSNFTNNNDHLDLQKDKSRSLSCKFQGTIISIQGKQESILIEKTQERQSQIRKNKKKNLYSRQQMKFIPIYQNNYVNQQNANQIYQQSKLYQCVGNNSLKNYIKTSPVKKFRISKKSQNKPFFIIDRGQALRKLLFKPRKQLKL